MGSHSALGVVTLTSTGLIAPVLELYSYLILGDKEMPSHHNLALMTATLLNPSIIFATFSFTGFALSAAHAFPHPGCILIFVASSMADSTSAGTESVSISVRLANESFSAEDTASDNIIFFVIDGMNLERPNAIDIFLIATEDGLGSVCSILFTRDLNTLEMSNFFSSLFLFCTGSEKSTHWSTAAIIVHAFAAIIPARVYHHSPYQSLCIIPSMTIRL